MSGVETPTPASKARRALSHRSVARAAQAIFRQDQKHAVILLAFLADLTYATESTLFEDAHQTIVASSKREIWLALNNMLRLSENDIRDLQERAAKWSIEQ